MPAVYRDPSDCLCPEPCPHHPEKPEKPEPEKPEEPEKP